MPSLSSISGGRSEVSYCEVSRRRMDGGGSGTPSSRPREANDVAVVVGLGGRGVVRRLK
jgi:hypothetical protein